MRLTFFAPSPGALPEPLVPELAGLLRALHRLGCALTLCERLSTHLPGEPEEEPEHLRLLSYASPTELDILLAQALWQSEWVIQVKAPGLEDEELDQALARGRGRARTALLDLDAPHTLARLAADPRDPFHLLLPLYHHHFLQGGGFPSVAGYRTRGARGATLLPPETGEQERGYRMHAVLSLPESSSRPPLALVR